MANYTTPPSDNLLFFSADDRQIDPSDPILHAVPSMGVVSHRLPESQPTDLSVLSALRAGHGGGAFPVSTEDEGGLLYSFTLPSTRSHSSKPPSVAESFGVLSTQISHSSAVSARSTHSATSSIISDSETFEPQEPLSSLPYSSDQERPPPPVTIATNEGPNLNGIGSEQILASNHSSRDVTPTPDLHGNGPQTAKSNSDQEAPHTAEDRTTKPTPTLSQEQLSSNLDTPPGHITTTNSSDSLLPTSTNHQPPKHTPPPCEDSSVPRESSTPPLSLPSPKEAFELPSHKSSRLDSDLETSSVVSVQHLTEAYLNDPFDSAEEKLTAGTSSTTVPVTLPAEVGSIRKSHTPTPVENKNFSLDKGFSSATSKVPSHIQAPPKMTTKKRSQRLPSSEHSPPISSTPLLGPLMPSVQRNISNKEEPGENQSYLSEHNEKLRDELTKTLQTKANLEGQLESVVNECKNTLKDRANLQSKLSLAEAQLADLTEALQKERARNVQSDSPKKAEPPSENVEIEQMKDEMEEAKTALDNEKIAAASLKNELDSERQNSQKLEHQLTDAKAALEEQKESLTNSQKKLEDLQTELEKKRSELSSEQMKSSSLEASYNALEEAKGWLHQQLQESMEAKMKLQKELSEAKANGIAQGIKAEQLMEENGAYQDQISQLQKAVLQDKARMVSELEAIEADVLSREDSFGHVMAEREELKDTVKSEKRRVEKLNSELARALVAKEEAEERAEDSDIKNDTLSNTIKQLQNKLVSTEKTLCDKESEMKRLEQALQEKLRGAEAALVGKDGVIQGLKDAREIMKQELDMTNDGRKLLEAELEEIKHQAASLEAKLKAAHEESKEKDSILRASEQTGHAMAAKNDSLLSQLSEKDRLLEEKVEELEALESQSGEIINHFKSLQDQFQSIASKNDNVQDSVAEKDRVIAHLASERDAMETELSALREANKQLDGKLGHVLQEKAHLEGKLDTSPSKSLEEFQKLLQDRSQLQAELNSMKIAHQSELIKAQAKSNHLESELRAAKRSGDQAKSELEEAIRKHDTTLSNLEDENYRLKSELKSAAVKHESPLKTLPSSHLKNSLQQAEKERNKLKALVEQLTRQNKDIGEQLEQEIGQKAEIERAGSVVAKKLKQNAQESEQKLQDQIQELKLQVEKLSGQLAGMELTQGAMREHTGELETALAKREAALLKLSAQAQKILEEKELEDKDLAEKMAALEKQVQDSKRANHIVKEAAKDERKKAAEFRCELSLKDQQLRNLERQLSDLVMETNSLKELMADVTTERDRLICELDNKTSQLRAVESHAVEDVRIKEAQVAVLSQEQEHYKDHVASLKSEVKLLQEQLRLAGDRHTEEVKGLKRALSEMRARPHASFNSSGCDNTDHGSSGFDGLLTSQPSSSTPSGLTREGINKKLEDLRRAKVASKSRKRTNPSSTVSSLDYSEAMQAEMASRLEQARRQGQEVAEIQKSGEIDALQEQLGSKNKKLHGLQAYLASLREDMGRMQADMERHSASMQAAHSSTRQIESQIENLKRSAGTPSYLSAPSISSNHSNCS